MSELIAVQGKDATGNHPQRRNGIAPPVDVFENADEVLVVADVPGVPIGAIELRVENGILTLETLRPSEAREAAPALAREYQEVDFVRTFRIPAGIDAAGVGAEAKNGTIVIRLPKTAAAKPHKIAVRSS